VYLYAISVSEVESSYGYGNRVKWVPCHHGMGRSQVADGGDGLEIWRVDANILNKQSRKADRG
jgi:hypothetical protein